MSVQSAPETYQCTECGGSRTPDESVGSFCSHTCLYRHKGANTLEQIKSDHRFCSTCFRQVKSVEKPPEEWVDDATSMIQAAFDAGATVTQFDGELALDATDASTRRRTAGESVVGYQYPTESANFVEDLRPVDNDRQHAWRKARGVYGCKCGAIDLRERDDILESAEGASVLVNLLRCLQLLYHQDAIQHRPEKDELWAGLREHWRDYEYAIGRALFA